MVYGDGQEVQVQHDVGYQYLTFSLKYPDTQPGEPTPGFPHEMLLSIEGG
jgi:hypothetical protein